MICNEECLPCIVNQVVKVANMTGAKDKGELYRKVFSYLSTLTFEETTPEIIGRTFAITKDHIKNDDPYKKTRNYYNKRFLHVSESLEASLSEMDKVSRFKKAAKFAIVGNVIDFNPIHGADEESIMKTFNSVDSLTFSKDYRDKLKEDLEAAKSLLYLGDNCGEICLDKLFIKEIKSLNPELQVYFAVRGAPVVNDSIEPDAYEVGLDKYAKIVSNGDDSLGTVLKRTSPEFKALFDGADVIISKGQANYESLSEEKGNIYFLLMTKCEIIANDIGVPVKTLVCKNKSLK